ncbi:DUF6151 family protein [Chachezhania sediminis]|uniref:DUF6151 family protein n=1 Tax=Chachezhania sediminis TaxID=2599291 RepID=UPI00131D5A37|nr:DUF6151 family protein [Chachezhania sediminis]
MPTTEPIRFACACGSVRGEVSRTSSPGGTHIICHCKYCRAGELWCGQPDPDPEGVAIFQTTADRVRFTEGQDHVGAFRLTKQGPYRWYATCCKAPLFNTTSSPGVPFAGMIAARAADPSDLGPVKMHVFRTQPDGTSKAGLGIGAVAKLMTGLAAARLSGRWKNTPFFDAATRKPLATPAMVGPDDSDGLYPPRR